MNINGVLEKVKQKKELSGIDDSIILESIHRNIKKFNINIEKAKPKDYKELIKIIRADLRKYAGRFQFSLKDRLELLEKGEIEYLLKTHSSTKERLESYPIIKRVIGELDIKSILDLGCGLNPIALSERGINYYACDINKHDLILVKKFFRKNNIDGEVFICDLRNLKYETLPSADLVLLFKVLDVIENRGHKLAEQIISTLKCRYLIASFSTKTLSGKPMNHPQRGWMERMLSRLNYKFKIVKTKNELFYFIDKY